MVSLANYYVLRILFGMKVHDFQNIQFHRTKVLQSFELRGESSFLGVEMMIRARSRGLNLIEVPIKFIPRAKGVSKGIRLTAIWKSCRDIARNWLLGMALARRTGRHGPHLPSDGTGLPEAPSS
jgi:hypothetical protein